MFGTVAIAIVSTVSFPTRKSSLFWHHAATNPCRRLRSKESLNPDSNYDWNPKPSGSGAEELCHAPWGTAGTCTVSEHSRQKELIRTTL